VIAVTKFSGVVVYWVYWYYGDTLLNPHIRYGREHLPSRGLFRLARIARLVVPGLPHHVTQRGNRRMNVFFSDDDHLLYLDLLKERCRKAGVEIWSYCLMPNHVHLILNPSTPQALGLALGETHRRYSSVINARLRVTGHLFQSRYGSAVMDEEHLMAAARYVALNPVRARLVARAQDWRWSSVRAHLAGKDDGYVAVAPILERCAGRFADLIDSEPNPRQLAALRAAETIGRPLGSDGFLDAIANLTGRDARPAKRGRRRGGFSKVSP
jgi:putative transposase